MDDAVANVLQRRALLEQGPGLAIAASVAFHAALAAALLWTAHRTPVPEALPAMTIKFAPAPKMTVPQRVAKAPKASPQAAPVPPAPLPKIEQPAIAPPRTTAPKPLTDATVPLSPFGRSSKTGEEKAPPPLPASTVTAPATTTATGAAAPLPAVGSSGVTGLEGTFPFPFYIDRMNVLIAAKWFRPPVKGERLTSIYFTIQRNGRIGDVKVEGSSGDAAFDRAAQRAVLEATPLPTLPFGYSGSYLGVHLTFH